MMEKTGDISPRATPKPGCCGGGRCAPRSTVMTKEAADSLERSTQNDAIDAVASQTAENSKPKV